MRVEPAILPYLVHNNSQSHLLGFINMVMEFPLEKWDRIEGSKSRELLNYSNPRMMNSYQARQIVKIN